MKIEMDAVNVKEFLSADEIRSLRESSNWRAFSMFAFNWVLIGLAMGLVANWPSVVGSSAWGFSYMSARIAVFSRPRCSMILWGNGLQVLQS